MKAWVLIEIHFIGGLELWIRELILVFLNEYEGKVTNRSRWARGKKSSKSLE